MIELWTLLFLCPQAPPLLHDSAESLPAAYIMIWSISMKLFRETSQSYPAHDCRNVAQFSVFNSEIKSWITAGWNVSFVSLNRSVTLELQTIWRSWVAAGWFHKSGLSNKSPAEFRARRRNVLCQWVTMLSCNLGLVSVCVCVCVCLIHSTGDCSSDSRSSLVLYHYLQPLPRFIVSAGMSRCAHECTIRCVWLNSVICVFHNSLKKLIHT